MHDGSPVYYWLSRRDDYGLVLECSRPARRATARSTPAAGRRRGHYVVAEGAASAEPFVWATAASSAFSAAFSLLAVQLWDTHSGPLSPRASRNAG
jgi:hypothetical protein